MCGVEAVLSVCFPRILKRAKAAKKANNASSVPTPYSGALKGGEGNGEVVGDGDGEGEGSNEGKNEGEGEDEGEGELSLVPVPAIGVPVRAMAAKVPTNVWGDWNSVDTEIHLP